MYPTVRPPAGASSGTARSEPNGPGNQLTLILLPVSVVLWVVGSLTTKTTELGPYGLIESLSPAFLLALAVFLISVGIEFAKRHLSEIRLGLHATTLVLMLYGTPALVYQEGRYSWLYKTVGVVQYVDRHGSLDRSIDIYQNWPGFFALAGWFDRVAGVSTPLDYAKWTQMVFELAAIPLLYTIYKSLFLKPWNCWLAIMLYSASNWIGQDYFSPQGMSTLISLGIMAVAARWIFVLERENGRPLGPGSVRKLQASRARRSLPFLIVLLLLFFVLTASHELTPYILTIQIATLAVCGLARPRWVALAVAAITIGYLAPNFTYVNSHYGLTASVGSFFSNVRPPNNSTSGTTPIPLPKSTEIINYCADALCLGVWLLAIFGAWRHRRSKRIVFALLILTFSPVLVLLGGAYGNEGVLRVYLFSLPWASVLASCALGPTRNRGMNVGRFQFRAVIPLALAMALFLPAFYGSDEANVMTPNEVNTLLNFQETAKPGVVLAALQNWAMSDTARYNEFPVGEIYGSYGVATQVGAADIATYLARSVRDDLGNQAAYVVVTPSMVAYNRYNALTAPASISDLLKSLAKSPYWQPVAIHDGTYIYSLTARAKAIPPGPHATAVITAVP